MNRKEKILSSVIEYIEEELEKKKGFVPGVTYIEASFPRLNPQDISSVVDAALNMWFTEGRYADKFKKGLKEYTGKEFCHLVNSGSSASLLATECIQESYGKDYLGLILTTALNFPTTVSGIYKVSDNIFPYYIDIDPKTLQPNMNQLEKVINTYLGEQVAGAILTHTLGFPFDERKAKEILGNDRVLVADCCDALGTNLIMHGYKSVGYYADIMTLSFFPAHHITSGEGGAILTDNLDYAEIIRSLANWGRDCLCLPGQSGVCGNRFGQKHGAMPFGYDHKYIFSRLGYNLKMTELQAALGASQLSALASFKIERGVIYDCLFSTLRSYSEYIDLIPRTEKINPFGFPVIVKRTAPFDPEELIFYLESCKIRTRRFFGGNLTKQPAFRKMPMYKVSDLSGTDYLAERGFWVGCHPNISNEAVVYMVEMFEEFFKERGL